jgi:predicted amidophosphoribosyltransferase
MNEVTTCCGSSYEDSWISDCCIVELHKDSDICPACGKNAEATGYICNQCGNWTEDLEDSRDYEERMRENYYEDMADARRKYGE